MVMTTLISIIACVVTVVAALVSAFRGLAQRLDEDIPW